MTQGGARARAILVLLFAVLFAAVPLVTGGFGGFDPQRFPVPQVNPPVQPPGWAFSIWGLIYVWLLVHAGYGLLRRDTDPGLDRTRLPMIVALGVGAAWIPVAKASPVLATAMIALMLAAAVLALIRAPRSDRLLAAAPIALFAGWLTAATGVSIGHLLAGYALTGAVTAALAALVWVLALASAVLAFRGEPAYAAGVAWALFGIIVANGLAQPLVTGFAAVGAATLAWFTLRGAPTAGNGRP